MEYIDFLASKVPITKEVVRVVYGEGIVSADKVYCYLGHYFIDVHNHREFGVALGNEYTTFKAIDEAEKVLFNYIKNEL